MRLPPLPRNCIALTVAALLTGVGLGACLTPGLGAVSLLVAITGTVLVGAFRLYEGRAVTQESRIAALEEHRRAVEAQNDRLEELSDSVARAMASLLGAVHGADDHHSRVPALAVAIGQEAGLDNDALAMLRTAAVLHDIGRLRIAPEIWAKPGPLTDAEWEQVRTHPKTGADLLRSANMPRPVEEIVRAQQERWDGTGYPARLKAGRIPLGARILAVADAYDALTSLRPWRDARTHRDALEILRLDAGAAFDPAVILAFERVAARGEFLDLAAAPAHNEKSPANP